MFEPFLTAFRANPGDIGPEPRRPWPGGPVRGFAELMAAYSGRTFDDGLYRLHTETSGRAADAWIVATFPFLHGRVHCFGFDWLGCQYALDPSRTEDGNGDGEPLVLLADPGWGEVLNIPTSFLMFHNVEVMRKNRGMFQTVLFEEWRAANAEKLPLRFGTCAGYTIPQFLGGSDGMENLDVVDLEVYWTLHAQMIVAMQGVPDGTPVAGATIADPER